MTRAARPHEEVLSGGLANRGRVIRIGNTVRRPLRPTSGSTHALLLFLERRGFDGAPRFLGVDALGREILSYIEGTVGGPNSPDLLTSDAALVSVAELLRRFHIAVAAFDPTGRTWPRPAPAPFFGTSVAHNDPNVDNVIFREGRAIAVIDFDLSSPTAHIWDIALAARLWAPLRDPVDIETALQARSLDRLRLFTDAYGLAPGGRGRLVDAVVATVNWTYDLVQNEVNAGHGAFTDQWRGGGAERATRTASWMARSREVLLDVLLA